MDKNQVQYCVVVGILTVLVQDAFTQGKLSQETVNTVTEVMSKLLELEE